MIGLLGRMPIRNALFLSFLVVAGAVLLLIVVGVRSVLREDLVDVYRTELSREIQLVAAELETAGPVEPDSVARALSSLVGHRITFVDSTGVVLGDSDVAAVRLGEVENHADRPEVAAALERWPGAAGTQGPAEPVFSERLSMTVGRRLLYAARVVEMDGDPVVLRVAASLQEVDATLDQLQARLAGAGLVATLLSLLAAFALSRSLARPVTGLAERARLLAEGDLDVRSGGGSRLKELDELGSAFDTLAEELQGRLGELGRERDQMQTLVDSMAEGVLALTDDARIMRANEAARELLDLPEPILYAPVGTIVRQRELRDLLESAAVQSFQSREVTSGERHLLVQSRMLAGGGAVVTLLDVTPLRRLEQVRRDFVANASHELKTPLTSLRGYAETLLEDDPPVDIRRRFLSSIHDNTIRLQRLVDDLLDLSRLESGGWVARPEDVPVAETVREAWGELAPRAAAKDLAFSVEGDAIVRADPRGLAEVLQNLLENSVEYTPEGGEVTVVVRREGDHVTIEVTDTGVGIPSADLRRVFERFYRADPARSRDAGGTGLGLAIVKHLVEAMHGTVVAESRLGRGTTVRLTLPRGESEERGGSRYASVTLA